MRVPVGPAAVAMTAAAVSPLPAYRGAPTARRVAVAVAAAQLLLAAVTAALLWRTGLTDLFIEGGLWFVVALVVYVVVGATIAFRRPDHPVGWLLAIAPVGMGAYLLLSAYAARALALPDGLPLADIASWAQTFAWAPSASMLFVFVPLLVPEGALPSPRWWLLAWASVIQTTVIVGLKAWYLWPVRGPLLMAPWFTDRLPPSAPWLAHTALAVAVWAFMPLGLAAAIGVLSRFARSRGVERQQLKWFLSGTALLVLGLALPPSMGTRGVLMTVAVALWPLATAVAVLRYRLYDIDRLLHRTLVYGLVSGLLAAGYLAAAGLVQALLPAAARSSLVVAASTLAAATLFRPVRDRVQRIVDSRFNRLAYDAELVLASFGRQLRTDIDREAVTGALLATVGTTVQPRSASVWLVGDTVR